MLMPKGYKQQLAQASPELLAAKEEARRKFNPEDMTEYKTACDKVNALCEKEGLDWLKMSGE